MTRRWAAPAATAPSSATDYPKIAVNPLVLHRSKLPFTISLVSFVALLILIFSPMIFQSAHRKADEHQFRFRDGECRPVHAFLALYLPHLPAVRHDDRQRLYRLQARRRRRREPGKSHPAEQLRTARAADKGGH